MLNERLQVRYEKLSQDREALGHTCRSPLTAIHMVAEGMMNSCMSYDRYKLCENLYGKSLGIEAELDKFGKEMFPHPEEVTPEAISPLMTIRRYESTLEEGAKRIINSASYIKEQCEGDLSGSHPLTGLIGHSAEKIIEIASMAASGNFLQDV
jgi:hypothetical protein